MTIKGGKSHDEQTTLSIRKQCITSVGAILEIGRSIEPLWYKIKASVTKRKKEAYTACFCVGKLVRISLLTPCLETPCSKPPCASESLLSSSIFLYLTKTLWLKVFAIHFPSLVNPPLWLHLCCSLCGLLLPFLGLTYLY